jgi:hypothetical protein
MLRPTRSGALLARLRGEYGGGESPVPTFVSISPSSGTEMGGTNVTITISGFDAYETNEVRVNCDSSGVGGEPLTDLTPISATQMTATMPSSPSGAGEFNIVVEMNPSVRAVGINVWTYI